eukprot:XP_014768755.1 PREDICTED: uncharacterized protein LOC106868139 [Octopus bimaculoides]
MTFSDSIYQTYIFLAIIHFSFAFDCALLFLSSSNSFLLLSTHGFEGFKSNRFQFIGYHSILAEVVFSVFRNHIIHIPFPFQDKNNFQSISMSKKLKRTLKEENEEWELQYFLVNSGGKMSCLLCDTAIVTVKKFNAQQHYVLHKGKKIYQIRG